MRKRRASVTGGCVGAGLILLSARWHTRVFIKALPPTDGGMETPKRRSSGRVVNAYIVPVFVYVRFPENMPRYGLLRPGPDKVTLLETDVHPNSLVALIRLVIFLIELVWFGGQKDNGAACDDKLRR
jgi:hypothetical protein